MPLWANEIVFLDELEGFPPTGVLLKHKKVYVQKQGKENTKAKTGLHEGL